MKKNIRNEPKEATGKAEMWHSGLWREGQWWSWWRAAVLSTYTMLSQSLSSLRAKPWITETRLVFCFNKIFIITHDFMEMIHEKPYTSLRAENLSCSQNTCIYTTSARRGSPAAGWYSGSLWASPYCCRPGRKLKLRLLIPKPLWYFPQFHLALFKAMAAHPCRERSHQALLPRSRLVWLYPTCSSKLLRLTVHPQTSLHPRTRNTYPR